MSARTQPVIVEPTREVLCCVIGGIVAIALQSPRRSPGCNAPTCRNSTTVRARWQSSEAYLLDRHGALIDQRADRLRRASLRVGAARCGLHGAGRRGDRRRGSPLLDSPRRRLARGARCAARQPDGRAAPRRQHHHDAVGGDDRSRFGRPRQRPRLVRESSRRRAPRAPSSRRGRRPQILEAYLNLLGFRGELEGHRRRRASAGRQGAVRPCRRRRACCWPHCCRRPARALRASRARACAHARALESAATCEQIEAAARTLFDRAAHLSDGATLAPDLARALLDHPGQRLDDHARCQRSSDGARRACSDRLRGLALHNVRDGAALVVDNETGDVLAYVGSAGPHRARGTSTACERTARRAPR